jgi:DNA-binding MarR family transcriptional regulator
VTDRLAERAGGRRAEAGEAPGAGAAPDLDLDRFLPYRLSVLQLAVSRALARIYARRFDLSRHEWRALAVLAREAPLTAGEVAARTSMDKVQVSRAIAKLIASGRVCRATDPADRRRAPLRPTAKGRALYRRIVPLVKAREAELTSVLTPAEARALDRIVAKLQRRARDLLDAPDPGPDPAPGESR